MMMLDDWRRSHWEKGLGKESGQHTAHAFSIEAMRRLKRGEGASEVELIAQNLDIIHKGLTSLALSFLG